MRVETVRGAMAVDGLTCLGLPADIGAGANVTAGYWQQSETNAETIVDGWLHTTGDIVRVDDAGRELRKAQLRKSVDWGAPL